MTIRLMVVDDHDLVRAGLIQYLLTKPGVEVVADAHNGKELLEKLKTVHADILLLDLTMPGISGVDLISLIKALYPDLHILILSAIYDVPTVLSVMAAGASGYISKNCSPQALFEAVKEVMVTGRYLEKNMAEQLLYASVSAEPDNEEIENLSNIIRLNGKTIKEWKEDCQLFYLDKVNAEKINDELHKEIIALNNQLAELKEKARQAKPQSASC